MSLSCKFYKNNECAETGGECMFLIPDAKACYDKFGEGPLAFEKEEEEEKENDKL